MNKTLYDILDVAEDASGRTLETAYIRLKNKAVKSNDHLALRAIEEAYQVLASPAQRAVYDNKLETMETRRMEGDMSTNTGNSIKMWLIFLALVIAGGTYMYRQRLEEKKLAREEAELQRKHEITMMEMEERKRQSEQQRLADEARTAQEQAIRDRERQSQQFQRESREYAREQDRLEREKQYQLRQEQERIRRENPPPIRPGIVYAR